MSTAPARGTQKRILVSGDLVVDHHIYEGERLARTTNAGLGVRHKAEVGGAEGIRRLLAAIDTSAAARAATVAAEAAAKASETARRQGKRAAEIQAAAAAREKHGTDHPLVRCHPVLGVVKPDLNVRYADHHAFAIWRPHVLDPKDASKGNVWRTSDKMGWGHREDVESLSGRPFELMPDAVHGTPDLLLLDDAGYLFRDEARAAC